MAAASDIEFARAMRGAVPEWGDNYIEQNVSPTILEAITAKREWTDVDGFKWGYCTMYATKIKSTKESVVVVASKYHGMGVYEMKVVTGPSKSTQQLFSHHLV